MTTIQRGCYNSNSPASKTVGGMIDIDTVKSMYEFSSPTIQEIVRNDMGNPDTWPEQVSEQEYDRIVDMFESASERE